ncbi:hypothetical protein GPECTOR_54g255 [Gonium pectorale]|uniref:Uncharacterized protein n=1 Tax=Gonium pectorale TaxID=33097 RepID=A0A150G6W7_GONPE|nr:hypothetical protein GPECTOR_54g255 [Gonium pectorale]|eukprot:KXZ45513.1 hypothetical protein GPECTOR_54g255 [Gonium pectorale]
MSSLNLTLAPSPSGATGEFNCSIAAPATSGAALTGLFRSAPEALTYFNAVAEPGTAGTLRSALGLTCNISSVAFALNTQPLATARLFDAANTPGLRCDVTARSDAAAPLPPPPVGRA